MRTFFRAVFGNLAIKLVSLFLALIVYVHVATDREQELNFTVPLRVVSLPDSLAVLSSIPQQARVSFRGKGREIYMALLRGTSVECDLSKAGPGLLRHLLSPRDVKLPVGVTVNVADVTAPETLSLQLDRRLLRRVPVQVVVSPPDTALSASAEPESVNVDGPASLVEGLDLLPTEAVARATVKPGADMVLTLKPGSTYLNVTPRQVRARFGASR